MNEPNADETESLPPYEGVDAPETQGREEFHITTENAANWYLRKLANLEAEKQRVTQQAAQIVRQLEADADGLRYRYEGELQEYVRRELAANGNRRKSLALLQGTACFRTVPPSLKITDAAAALDFCRRHLPDAAKMQAEADALPVGVDSVPAKEAFSVKF